MQDVWYSKEKYTKWYGKMAWYGLVGEHGILSAKFFQLSYMNFIIIREN